MGEEVGGVTLLPKTEGFETSVAKVARAVYSPLRDAPVLSFEYFSAGITNTLVCVGDDRGDRCLVRVYGAQTELLIDRERELMVLVSLRDTGRVPYLYGRFANGYVCSYTPGRTVTRDQLVSSGPLRSLVAREMSALHGVDPVPAALEGSSQISTLRSWVPLVPPGSPSSWISEELEWLGGVLPGRRVSRRMTVCHNDLLLGNVVYDEGRREVRFIDWEYATAGWPEFDLANHFCEWCGFECEWGKFPTRPQQEEFLTEYLAGREESGDVARWAEAVEWFELLSHMFWGVWALVQSGISKIDFDYRGYSTRRFDRYRARKSRMLLDNPKL